MTADCPTRGALAAFHRGGLPPTDADHLADHLDHCPRCEAALAALDARPGPLAAALRLAGPAADTPAVVADRYKLVEEIGEGGMGSVWLAEQTAPVRRAVAVKFIKAGMDSKTVLARFEAERQALALMDHPNIAKVFDGGLAGDGRPFFAMELVRGVPITRYCDEAKLPLRDRLALFVPVCRAIQHAHQKGVIHRDIKPSNVLVAVYDDAAVPKVIDFGIAKAAGQPLTDRTLVTGFAALVGSPEYMAPEQAALNQADVDTRADVYALGALLYDLLTGSPPLTRQQLSEATLAEALQLVREAEPPRPSARLSTAAGLPQIAARRGAEPPRLAAQLRGELDWIVMKCLEKDRTRRYDTVAALARDVERYLADEPVEAGPPSARYRLGKFARRYRGPLRAAAAAGLLLAAATGVSVGQAWRATRAEGRAVAERDEKNAALAAAQDELAAREAVQAFFLDKVFAAGRPVGEEGGLGHDVSLRRAVDAAVPAVGEAFRGRPLVEATVRRVLGQTYMDLGECNLAGEQFLQVLVLRDRHLGPDHLETARGKVALAAADAGGWRPLHAIALYDAALATFRAKLGPDAAETVACTTGLADAYDHAGRPADAARLYEDALRRGRAALGADHPTTLTALEGLAVAYRAVDRLADAIPLADEAVRLRTAKFGPDRRATLMSRHILGVLYSSDARGPEAVAMFEAVVPAMAARLGPNHPDTFQARFTLGTAYALAGRPADMVRVREESLRICEADRGAGDRVTAHRMGELADAYAAAGRLDDALRLANACWASRRAEFGSRDPITAGSGFQVGRILLLAGRADEAEPLVAEHLAVERAARPAGHPTFANRLTEAGEALVAGGRFATAEPPLREALAIRERTAPDGWPTAHARSLLGAALAGQGKATEAEPLMLAGYDRLNRRPQPHTIAARKAVIEAADRLARFYAAAGRAAEAARWRAERDAVTPPWLK